MSEIVRDFFPRRLAKATILLIMLTFSIFTLTPLQSSVASASFATSMHKQEDVFNGRFSSQVVSLVPNQVVDVRFSICPTMDAPDTAIQFFMPVDIVKLVKGEHVWRGDVKKSETLTLQLSISVEEEVYVGVRADVKASMQGKTFSSSYYLGVTSMNLETAEKNRAPSKQVGSPNTQVQAAPTLMSPGTITIRGRWVYVNEVGGLSPMRKVLVWLRDVDSVTDEWVASTYTDEDGRYSFTVDNDDGWLQDGRDPYVEVYAEERDYWVTKTGDLIPGEYVSYTPKAGDDVPDGFYYDYGTRFPVAYNEAWQAGDAVTTEAWWILSQPNKYGLWDRSKVTINWPKEDWPHSHGDSIHLPDKSASNWTHVTVYHEYAHCVMWTLYGNSWPPGDGPDPHYVTSESSLGFAFMEGWAEFMEAAVDNNPNNLPGPGQSNIEKNAWYLYADTGDMDGNIIEGSVASILWDIFDPKDIADEDNMDWGFDEILAVLRYDNPNNIGEFWWDWIARWPDLSTSAGPLSTIYWHYGIDYDAYIPMGSFSINLGALYTTSIYVTLTSSMYDYGSGLAYMRFSNNNIDWSVWYVYATSCPWTLPSGDGAKTVYAQFIDHKGLSTSRSYDIVLDTAAPTGSIVINSGYPDYTTTTSVTLYLTYSDATSGVDKVRYGDSLGTFFFEPWETPTTTRAWNIGFGEGAHTVYYQIIDKAGLLSTIYNDTIILDTEPPWGYIDIEGYFGIDFTSENYTTTTSVTLWLTAVDYTSGVDIVRYSNDGVWDTELWEAYSRKKVWNLTTGDGNKTVYYQIIDKAGLLSPTYNDTIILDTTPPTGSILINAGDTYTNSRIVTLYLTYSDVASGVLRVRYSVDGVWDTEPWENPATTKVWELSFGDGNKIVYYQIMDWVLLLSPTYSDAIILDTSAPTGSIVINAGDDGTTSTSVTLNLTYSDATSGVDKVRYSNDGVWDTEPWENPATMKAWDLTLGDGIKRVYYQIKDKVGLLSPTYSDTIILDTTPPTGSIVIGFGNPKYTTTMLVVLNLTYFDATSVNKARYSNDGVWDTEPWENPTVSKVWNLTTGDGNKTVYYQIKDWVGLLSPTYSDTIILDTTPPTASISINEGAWYTNSTSVTLYLTYSDATSGVDKVRYRNDGEAWAPWETPTTTKTWNLTAGTGGKWVYCEITDLAGWVSPTYSAAITLDTTAPTGSIVIGFGNPKYTTVTSVTLFLGYSDVGSGVDKVRYSNDGVWDTEPWEAPTVNKAWTLATGDGDKIVCYQIIDLVGWLSPTYNDTIILDATPPTGSISINAGDAYTNSTSVTLYLTYSDALSGVDKVSYSNYPGWWGPWETPTTTRAWNIGFGEGAHTVYYQIIDKAGASAVYNDTIILDTIAPTTTISHSPGSSSVSLSATDATSGVYATYYRIDLGPWTTYTDPFTLTGTDSNRIDYYSQDNAENNETAKTLTEHYLTVNTDPAGITTIFGTGWYDNDTTATTGTAPANITSGGIMYTFLTWKKDGTFVTENPIDILMDAPHIATAVYNKTASTLVVPVAWNGITYMVELFSNSNITAFSFNQSNKLISFNVSGLNATAGFCNITILKELLDAAPAEWIVLVDYTAVDPTITWNTTHTSIYFTYTHSTHTVKIIGTQVVPEFSSAITLPLLMVLTMLAVIFAKRRALRKPKI